MKKFSSVLTLALVLGGIAGCASAPEQLNATPNSVTYQYDGDDLKKANDEAVKYCNSAGKAAVLRNTSTQSGGKNVAIFDCQ